MPAEITTPLTDAPATPYPGEPAERTRWILARRAARPLQDWRRPQAVFWEREPTHEGGRAEVLTVLLTSRECPWRCLMCDLWKSTNPGPTPPGAIPAQIATALASPEAGRDSAPPVGPEPAERHLKLYNSGSFFDVAAVPLADRPAIAALAAVFQRVIVECHPKLVGPPVVTFRDQLAKEAARLGRPAPQLELALGLETAHPEILTRLNKRMTLDDFRRAAAFLAANRIALRTFILVQPPFLEAGEALEWACRSLDLAFAVGATAAVLIPTRGGNGAMEALAHRGSFVPPRLEVLEAAMDYGLRLRRGRVFADLWERGFEADCPACRDERCLRLARLNTTQTGTSRIQCGVCGQPGGSEKRA